MKMAGKKKNTTRGAGPANPTQRRTRTRSKKQTQPKTTPASAVRKELSKVKQQIKVVKERTDGPKVQDQFTTTVDLGLVEPVPTDSLTRVLGTVFNPTILKAPTSGTTSTPLTIRASQYQLWRLKSLKLVFLPQVGASAVAGTTFVASLLQNSGVAPEVNLDAIYTRPNMRMQMGRPMSWVIPPRYLLGPKQGWYTTNPNQEQMTTLGPLMEVHGYGKTWSTYQDKAWNGPLWRCTATVTFEFTSYGPEVPLANLERDKTEGKATVKADTEGNAVVKLENPSGFAAGPHAGNVNGVISDVIWGIGDVLVESASAALPGWGWLIGGAWWFIKKISGRSLKTWLVANPDFPLSDGWQDVYYVYRSFDDARTNTPWQPPLGTQGTLVFSALFDWTQLTPMDGTTGTPASQPTYPLPPATPVTGLTLENLANNLSQTFVPLHVVGGTPYNPTLESSVIIKDIHGEGITPPNGKLVQILLAQKLGGSYTYHSSSALAPHPKPAVLDSGWDGGQGTLYGDALSLFKWFENQEKSGVSDPWVTNVTMGLTAGGSSSPSPIHCLAVYCHFYTTNQADPPRHSSVGLLMYGISVQDWYDKSPSPPRSLYLVLDSTSGYGADCNAEYQGQPHTFFLTHYPPNPSRGGFASQRNLVECDGVNDSGASGLALLPTKGGDAQELALYDLLMLVDADLAGNLADCVMCRTKVKHSFPLCFYMRTSDSVRRVLLCDTPFQSLLESWGSDLECEDWYGKMFACLGRVIPSWVLNEYGYRHGVDETD
uniref:Capsid protein n=1 Tax=Beihai tree frog astrovirus TaxID=2116129 RepID=A0A2P1GMZ8_9VIRU|nr:capsid protein [Beihai tree frog astrovirus]